MEVVETVVAIYRTRDITYMLYKGAIPSKTFMRRGLTWTSPHKVALDLVLSIISKEMSNYPGKDIPGSLKDVEATKLLAIMKQPLTAATVIRESLSIIDLSRYEHITYVVLIENFPIYALSKTRPRSGSEPSIWIKFETYEKVPNQIYNRCWIDLAHDTMYSSSPVEKILKFSSEYEKNQSTDKTRFCSIEKAIDEYNEAIIEKKPVRFSEDGYNRLLTYRNHLLEKFNRSLKP